MGPPTTNQSDLQSVGLQRSLDVQVGRNRRLRGGSSRLSAAGYSRSLRDSSPNVRLLIPNQTNRRSGPYVCLGSSPEVNANPKVGLLCASKRTPALSPVGILAKISAFYFEDERAEWAEALAEPGHGTWDDAVLGAVYADLERLAGEGVMTTENDTEIVSMWHEYCALLYTAAPPLT